MQSEIENIASYLRYYLYRRNIFTLIAMIFRDLNLKFTPNELILTKNFIVLEHSTSKETTLIFLEFNKRLC